MAKSTKGKKNTQKTSGSKPKSPGPNLTARDEPAAKTTLDTVYIVNGSGNMVTLEVNAGAKGQTSDMTIMLDDDIIVEKLAGDFKEKSLGTNKQLNGKKLSIVATIADTSRETNLTTLAIHLKGGVQPNDFPLSKTVDDEGTQKTICVLLNSLILLHNL